MPHVEMLVLGAGPTGLGAAWRMHELGETDWLVVEASNTPGGMSASERDPAGFIWDLGGHVIHSHFPYFDVVLEGVKEWAHPHRSGWVRLGDRFVPTPIQHHLGSLPGGLGAEVIAELSVLPPLPVTTLRDYFLATFGSQLTDVFFSPFNSKMWAHPLEVVDHEWTSLRSGSGARNVPGPTLTLTSPAAPDDTSTFPYPLHGTGGMWAEIAGRMPQDRIRYNTTVCSVDLARREVQTLDGSRFTFEHCVSSLPLGQLLSILVDRPELSAQAPLLLHSSVHAVGLGFDGEIPPGLAGKSWVYSPDPAVPFYRSTILSNYSQALAGPGRWSVLHEVGTSPSRPVDAATVVADCIEAMRPWGASTSPASAWHRYLPYGYPVPFLGRDATLHPLLSALEAHGVRSRGRFGGWRYESSNQDYAFMQGVEAVDAELTGAPETTFWSDRPLPATTQSTGRT
jgi:protoporphyrinogen oxidase